MSTADTLLTAEQLIHLPNNGLIQELVRGKVIEMPPPKFRHGVVCGNVYFIIRSHVEANQIPSESTTEGTEVHREYLLFSKPLCNSVPSVVQLPA